MARELSFKLEADWDDDGRFDHRYSDMTSYIDSLSIGFGTGVLNNPADYSISVLAGQARTLVRMPVLPEEGLYRRHAFRLFIDESIFCVGFIIRVTDLQYRMESRNYELLNADVRIPISTAMTDSQLWATILAAAGLRDQGTNYFNGYSFADLIIMDGSVRNILADFAKLAGGYVLEHNDGSLSFVAPRARLNAPGEVNVDPLQTAIFEMEISNKPHAIRNRVSTAIPIVGELTGQEIASVDVELESGASRTLRVPAPSSSLVTAWNASIDNTNISLATDASSTFEITLTVSNTTAAAQTGKVTVTGTVKSVVATEPLETERLGSIDIWGVIPYDKLPEWLGDTEALEQELSRRDSPLRTANIEMPLLPDVRSWVFLDPGALAIVNQRDLSANMMVARKYVALRRAGISTLRWHMIEFPLNYPDEFWRLDDGDFRLDVSAYLGDLTVPVAITLTGDHLVYFPGQGADAGDDLLYMDDHLKYMNDQLTYFHHDTDGDILTYMGDRLTYF